MELLLLGVGLVACVGIATRGFFIGPDRFNYPKEFALDLFALAMALSAIVRAAAIRVTRLDALLLGFISWNAIAASGATNPWWAHGAVGVTAACLVVFWVSRTLRDQGHERLLLGLVSLAVVVAAAAAIMEAHGVFRVSVGSRAPGGTLGNRNSMAHLLVLGTPTLLLFAVGLRRRVHAGLVALAIFGTAMAVMLSRSRGAWLATLLSGACTILLLRLTWPVVREVLSRRRLLLWAGSAVAGAAAAAYLPNDLAWKSDTPYRDTLRGLVEFDEGSGRGRILQNRNTLRMIGDHPALGVGPGNWAIAYAHYAPPGDPTHDRLAVVPVSRYIVGDWAGVAAETGVPGLALLVAAGWTLVRWSGRAIRRRKDVAVVLRATALLATLVALTVMGSFDSVLRTPAAGFLAFTIMGVLGPRERGCSLRVGGRVRRLALASVALVLGAGAVNAGRQLWAAVTYATSDHPALLARAVAIYPGDYRAHVLLATALIKRDRCDLARPHIEQALTLFPTATLPTQLHIQCVTLMGGS